MLHLLDVRYKFFMMSLICISMVSAKLFPCLIYFIILLFFLKKTGCSILETFISMKYFFLLLLFVFAARALTQKGDIIVCFFDISITQQGAVNGFALAFRFFLIMLTGLIFTLTTRPGSIKAAAQWYLKPVPFIPEKRASVMISLSLKFMPIILKQAQNISNARKARCGDLQKNPVKKTISLILPLLKKVFLSADNLVMAMESRCYNEDRTDPEFSSSGKEILFLAAGVIISLSLILF